MGVFVFGTGFRVSEPEPRPAEEPSRARAPVETLWCVMIPDFITAGNTETLIARDREVLVSWCGARGYEGEIPYLRRLVVRTAMIADSPRERCIKHLNLSPRDWPGRRHFWRDPAVTLGQAGYVTLGRLADAGVDGLRALKMPSRLIRVIDQRLGTFGLSLKPSSEADAA